MPGTNCRSHKSTKEEMQPPISPEHLSNLNTDEEVISFPTSSTPTTNNVPEESSNLEEKLCNNEDNLNMDVHSPPVLTIDTGPLKSLRVHHSMIEEKLSDNQESASNTLEASSPELKKEGDSLLVASDGAYAGYTHVLRCPVCSFLTLTTSALQRHALGAHKGSCVSYSTFTCAQCSAISTERDLMQEHVKLYHRNTQSPIRLIEERHTLADHSPPRSPTQTARKEGETTPADKSDPPPSSIYQNGIADDVTRCHSNGVHSNGRTPTPDLTSSGSTVDLRSCAQAGNGREGVHGSRRRKPNNPGRFQNILSSSPPCHIVTDRILQDEDSLGSPPDQLDLSMVQECDLKNSTVVPISDPIEHSTPSKRKKPESAVGGTKRQALSHSNAKTGRGGGKGRRSRPVKAGEQRAMNGGDDVDGVKAAFLDANFGMMSFSEDVAYDADSEQALDMSMKSCSSQVDSPTRTPKASPCVKGNAGLTYHLPASSQLMEMASRLSPRSCSAADGFLATALAAVAANGGTGDCLSANGDVLGVLNRLGAASAMFQHLQVSSGAPVDLQQRFSQGQTSPVGSAAGNESHLSDAESSSETGVAMGNEEGTGSMEEDKANSGGRPHRQNFTPQQNKILMEWYQEHRDKPYPSTEETNALAKKSDLSYPQVKKWFANKRARTSMCVKKSPRGTGNNNNNSTLGTDSSPPVPTSPGYPASLGAYPNSGLLFAPFLFPSDSPDTLPLALANNTSLKQDCEK